MPVVGVLAQAHVAEDEQVGRRALDRPDRLLHDALLVVRLGAGAVLGGGQTEQDHTPQPQPPRPLGVLHRLVH